MTIDELLQSLYENSYQMPMQAAVDCSVQLDIAFHTGNLDRILCFLYHFDPTRIHPDTLLSILCMIRRSCEHCGIYSEYLQATAKILAHLRLFLPEADYIEFEELL